MKFISSLQRDCIKMKYEINDEKYDEIFLHFVSQRGNFKYFTELGFLAMGFNYRLYFILKK